jgi:hypothetical protein
MKHTPGAARCTEVKWIAKSLPIALPFLGGGFPAFFMGKHS